MAARRNSAHDQMPPANLDGLCAAQRGLHAVVSVLPLKQLRRLQIWKAMLTAQPLVRLPVRRAVLSSRFQTAQLQPPA